MQGFEILPANTFLKMLWDDEYLYVAAELDAGPIIEQDVVRITHKDNPESLVLKGRDLEKIVLSRAVKKHIERKILTYHNKTIIFS